MISRSAVAVLVLILAFALIPPVSAPSAARVVESSAPPASLRIGSLRMVDSLNPFIGLTDSSYLLYGLLYDYPFSFDQDGNYVSNLIVNASCDAACMNWTYQVRPGVVWSDGTPLTADDVAFTWNYTSQNLGSLYAFEPYFNQVVPCSPSTQPHCGAYVTSPGNVTVYFARPYVAGRSLFAPILEEAQWSGITPGAAQTTFANADPIGTGPFIADPNIYGEWLNQTTVPIHVYRNAQYHPVGSHTGASYIADIYLYLYSDENSLALALEAGNIDLASMTISGIQSVRGSPSILVQTPLQAIQQWNEIGISQIDTGAADGRLNAARWDVHVRTAMARATNKDYIVQNLYQGQGVRGDSLISPITPQWWYDPVTGGDNLSYDLSAANALLNTTGWNGTWSDGLDTYRMNPNAVNVSFQTACFQCVNPANVTKTIPAGTHLQFTLAVRPPSLFPEESFTATYLAAAYKQIGIKIVIKVETTEPLFAGDVYGGNVEMYIWSWSGDPDPTYLLYMESSWSLDGWNDNYWNNATYNHRYLDQLADQNLTQRIAAARAAQRIQYESATYLIYIYAYGEWAMRSDLWQGWGNWTDHPYRQMNAYWGANPLWFDLYCPTCAGSPNFPPTPPVISGPTYVSTYTNTTLSFTATSSDPEPGDRLNWTWSWGDGNTTVTTGNASNPTSTAAHAWTLPGNYTVNVSVDDGNNPPVASVNPVFVNVSTPPPPPGWIQGTVTNATGAPIAGAQVSTTPGNLTYTTGGDGVYNLTLSPGTYNVTVSASLYLSQTKTGVTVAPGSTTIADFILASFRGWIAGTVSDSVTGLPISGAALLATSQSNTESITSTDSQGDYNLTLEPGTYRVNVTASGHGAAGTSGVPVSQHQTAVVDFLLVPTQTPVQASVSDQTGRPGQAMTISGTITATGSGNWTLRFGDGAAMTGSFYPGTTPISESHSYAAEGTYTIHLFATTGADIQLATATALVDGTAPTTTASLAGTAGNNSWFRSSVQVTLTATDAMSGIASTSYSVDGGSWQAYAAAFTVSGDGNHTVDYRSTDVVGNAEATKTLLVKIDTGLPTLSASDSGTRGVGVWYTSNVTVTLGATDGMSGVAEVRYNVDSGTWQTYTAPFVLGDGEHTVSLLAIDLAGNARPFAIGVFVDTVAPSVAIRSPSAGSVFSSADIMLNWTASDATSGLSVVQVSIDNGSPTTPSQSPTLLGGLADGPHIVTIRVTDQAGNLATASVTFTVKTATSAGLDPLVIGSVGAVIVVAAIVAVLLLRRRAGRKPKQPSEP